MCLVTNSLSYDPTCKINGLKLFKYADDMALVANLTDEHTLSTHRQYVSAMALWF